MTVSAHPQPARVPRDVCASCGGPLGNHFYTLLDRPDRYCARCIATRPRCASCGAPLADQHWRLHDDRCQCAACHAVAVYDLAAANALYNETVAGVVAQLGLRLNIGVAFRLVDAPTIEEVRGRGEAHQPLGPRSTLGLYQRQGRLRVIYMLYGLPKLVFRTTVAHEYAHAWQGENCPLLNDELLREGFAEWVAYKHLLWLGCTRAAQRLRVSQHPYRPALDHVVALEQRLGPPALLDYMRRAE